MQRLQEDWTHSMSAASDKHQQMVTALSKLVQSAARQEYQLARLQLNVAGARIGTLGVQRTGPMMFTEVRCDCFGVYQCCQDGKGVLWWHIHLLYSLQLLPSVDNQAQSSTGRRGCPLYDSCIVYPATMCAWRLKRIVTLATDAHLSTVPGINIYTSTCKNMVFYCPCHLLMSVIGVGGWSSLS